MTEYDLDKEVPRIGKRAEILACYYIRFNGFFILPNFIIHDAGLLKQPGGQLTEADLLAIRLPYENEHIKGENFEIPVQTHSLLDLKKSTSSNSKIPTMDFVIAEVSSEKCKFNWYDEVGNTINHSFLDYALNRIGWWPDTTEIVKQLSHRKFCKREESNFTERIRLLSIGKYHNPDIDDVMQITFHEILHFFRDDLFMSYGQNEKFKPIVSDHKQWDKLICQIYNKLLGHKTEKCSVDNVLKWLFPDIEDT